MKPRAKPTHDTSRPLKDLAEDLGMSRHGVYALLEDFRESPQYIVLTSSGRRKIRGDKYDELLAILRGEELVNSVPDEERYILAIENARKAHYEAHRAKLKYLQEAGILVRRDEIRGIFAGAVEKMKAELMQLPRQLAAELNPSDPSEAEKVLEKYIRATLTKLRATIAADGSSGDGGDSLGK